MKFLISFLLLVLVASNQASVRTVETIDIDVFDIENFIGWSEIWDKIKEFMKKAKEVMESITGDMKGIIEKIKNKIKEIVGVGSVSEITDKIIAAIKKMVGTVNPKVTPCIDQQKDTIKKIATEAQAGTKACADDAQSKLKTIEVKATAIKNEATQLLTNAAKDGSKCILKPSTAPKCLIDILDNLKIKGKELITRGKEMVNNAKNLLSETTTCANQVRQETADKIKNVFNVVVNCVSASQYLY